MPQIQLILIAVAEAIREIDMCHLEGLAPAQLTAQGNARWELYGYLDQLWSGLKAPGNREVDPILRQSLAGLRDIASTLCSDTDRLRFQP